MSIHSSLRISGKGNQHRSVLKRYERLAILKDKKLWDDSKSVLGLVKVKMQKIKVKKEKAAGAEGQPASGAAPAAASGAPAKAAAGAKTDKK